MSQHDVIVIGAGFTGLSAANVLADAGLDVVVLEARGRVGGRVESKILGDGSRIDSGGQFLCEDMPEVMALARTHGKTLLRSPIEGDIVFQPHIAAETGYEIYNQVDALRAKMRGTDLADRSAGRYSVAEWLARQDASDAVKRGFHSLVEGLWCRSIDDVSFRYLASSDQRITNRQSELEFFLAETMHSLADDLAARLGDHVRLDCPVTRLIHSPDGVEAVTAAERFSARRAVVALPPVMARRLAFEPALTAQLANALAAWGTGAVIKALVRYARPFWRDDGLSGTVMWNSPHGLYACDVSRGGGDAALVLFIGGPLAIEWHVRDEDAIRQMIREKLASALGEQAGKPLDISLRDWTDDPWSGGAYSDTIIDAEAVDAEQVMLEGLPAVRFACSELSASFPGYIEGAIVAGKAAAKDVLDAMRRG